eukprot:4141498-Amphidinium_carterae.2
MCVPLSAQGYVELPEFDLNYVVEKESKVDQSPCEVHDCSLEKFPNANRACRHVPEFLFYGVWVKTWLVAWLLVQVQGGQARWSCGAV